MASPQLENGHTRIANEVIESIFRARLSGNSISVLLYILRQTYGWGGRKKTEPFSPTFFGDKINMSKGSVSLAIQFLIETGIVVMDENKCLSFVKDYEKWSIHVQPTERIVQPTERIVQPTERIVQPTEQYKEKEILKERKKKDSETGVVKSRLVRKETPIQAIVRAYKHAKNVEMSDKNWDECNFKRFSKAAKHLLACFKGDIEKSAAYIFLRAEDLNEKNLEWTLETIARHAWDGMGMPQGAINGLRDKPMATSIVNEPGSNRGFTQAGEIVGDSLRAIEHAAIHPEESRYVAGLDDDKFIDQD